jgi:hypothetical protein
MCQRLNVAAARHLERPICKRRGRWFGRNAAVGKTTHCHQSGSPCNVGGRASRFAPCLREMKSDVGCSGRYGGRSSVSPMNSAPRDGTARRASPGAALRTARHGYTLSMGNPADRAPLFANSAIAPSEKNWAARPPSFTPPGARRLLGRSESTPPMGTVPESELVETALRAHACAPDFRAAQMAEQLIFR